MNAEAASSNLRTEAAKMLLAGGWSYQDIVKTLGSEAPSFQIINPKPDFKGIEKAFEFYQNTKNLANPQDAKPSARVRTMDQTQILELFGNYGFTDELGHPLVNCADFLELVERSQGSAMEGATCLPQLREAIAILLSQLSNNAARPDCRNVDAEKLEILSRAIATLAASATDVNRLDLNKLDYCPGGDSRAIASTTSC